MKSNSLRQTDNSTSDNEEKSETGQEYRGNACNDG